MKWLNCPYITDTFHTTATSGDVHKARSLIQTKAQFRHTAQNRFQWIRLALKRTSVQGQSKLWGGQLPLCADLWAILSHFDLSSDDGVAGTDSGAEGLGTGGTWRVTACFVFILSLILGITSDDMQTDSFSEVFLFLAIKSSPLKREIKGEAGSLITV